MLGQDQGHAGKTGMNRPTSLYTQREGGGGDEEKKKDVVERQRDREINKAINIPELAIKNLFTEKVLSRSTCLIQTEGHKTITSNKRQVMR